MNFRATFYKPTLVGLAALLLCGTSRMQNLLNADRGKLGFTVLEPLENAPPILAFTTVALGGFRGLISNVLWIRADELQDEGRYFEMVQLADWISKLEPHFATVWIMQAWNMAFNISVKCKDFEERWRWVQRGLQLLQEGIKYNPGDITLYKELSWFFRFKIGQNLDDAHMLYKYRWAQQMQDVLGGHPDFPALLNPRTPEERERVRKLREDYQMDPAIIQEIDTNYGPLDWRLPDAHAIYWAEMGVRNGTVGTNFADILRRFPAQELAASCFRGSALPPWVQRVTPENFILWPNLDMVTNVNAAYERTQLDDPSQKKTAQGAQKNFLKDAIILLYEYNRTREAAYWFDYVRQNFTNAFTPEEAGGGVENYALAQINSSINEHDQNKAHALILGLLFQEDLELIADQDKDAQRFNLVAHAVWDHYQSRLTGDAKDKERVSLKPFGDLEGFEFTAVTNMVSPQAAAKLSAKLGLSPAGNPPATNAPPPAPEAAPPTT
ncbi:MAG: hypothetical protein ABSA47_16035 [Verrucomicrobiota bacterium]|jgi:hypothetical protein